MAKAIVLVAAVVLVIVTLCESAPSSSSSIELVRRDTNSSTDDSTCTPRPYRSDFKSVTAKYTVCKYLHSRLIISSVLIIIADYHHSGTTGYK